MQKINEILDAKLIEHYKNQEKRDYLGASSIGDDCLRKVQLQYEGKEADFSASTLRTFDIGHCLESLIIQWMRIAGFDIKDKDENGKQFGFSVADGKLQGHVDGLIYSIPGEQEQLKPAWLLEIKTLNSKSWKDTEKRGVMISKPIYFSQIQLYLAYMELEMCLFVALNKDTSELYFEMIPFDSEAAQRYSDRAAQVIKASENNELLPCVSSDPSFFKCKMCSFRNECRPQETLK